MPVWEQFLTERDKQHQALAWNKQESFGLGEHPALVIIDNVYGVVGDKPLPILESVKTWPLSCGLEGWEAIYKTQELLTVARSNRIPVVYTCGLGDFTSPWGVFRSDTVRRPPTELRELGSQIVKELSPETGELVIRKAAPSAFFGTPLVAHLIHLGVDTVIACGNTTSGCVRASVIDGSSLRFRMGVVEECTFDRTEASHAVNLFDMDQKYADVLKLSDCLAYFCEVGGRVPQVAGRR